MKLIQLTLLLTSLAVKAQKFRQEHFPLPPQFQTPNGGIFPSDSSLYLPPESHTPIPYFPMKSHNGLQFPLLPPTGTKAPSIYPSPFPFVISTTLVPHFEDEDDDEDHGRIRLPSASPIQKRVNQTERTPEPNKENREMRAIPMRVFSQPIQNRNDIKFNFKPENPSPALTSTTVSPNQTPAARRMIIESQKSDLGLDQLRAASLQGPQFLPAGGGLYVSSTTEPAIPILRLSNEMDLDGSFSYEALGADQTHYVQHSRMENLGPDKQEQVVEGSYSYVGDNGQTYTVHYIADSNGFRASGDHLPVAPPVPEIIQRAVQYNLAEEAKKPPHLRDNGFWQDDRKDNEISDNNKSPQFSLPPTRNLFTGRNPEAFSFSFSQGSNTGNNLVAAASNQPPMKTVEYSQQTTEQPKQKPNNGPISPQITFLASQGAHVPSLNPVQNTISRMFTTDKSPMSQLMNYEAGIKEADQDPNKGLWRWQYGINANNLNQNTNKDTISRSFSEGDDIMINFSDMTPEQYTNMIRSQYEYSPEQETVNEYSRNLQFNQQKQHNKNQYMSPINDNRQQINNQQQQSNQQQQQNYPEQQQSFQQQQEIYQRQQQSNQQQQEISQQPQQNYQQQQQNYPQQQQSSQQQQENYQQQQQNYPQQQQSSQQQQENYQQQQQNYRLQQQSNQQIFNENTERSQLINVPNTDVSNEKIPPSPSTVTSIPQSEEQYKQAKAYHHNNQENQIQATNRPTSYNQLMQDNQIQATYKPMNYNEFTQNTQIPSSTSNPEEESRKLKLNTPKILTHKDFIHPSQTITQSYNFDEDTFYEPRKIKSLNNSPMVKLSPKNNNELPNSHETKPLDDKFFQKDDNSYDKTWAKMDSEYKESTTAESFISSVSNIKYSDFVLQEGTSDFKPIITTTSTEAPKPAETTTQNIVADILQNNIFLKNLFNAENPGAAVSEKFDFKSDSNNFLSIKQYSQEQQYPDMRQQMENQQAQENYYSHLNQYPDVKPYSQVRRYPEAPQMHETQSQKPDTETQKQPETKVEAEPKSDKVSKLVPYQPSKQGNDVKSLKKKPVDIADILNYVTMKNHFESGKVKNKIHNNKQVSNFDQRNEVRFIPIQQERNENHGVSEVKSTLRPHVEKHEELRGLIKNYKVLHRNNNNVKYDNSQLKRELSPPPFTNLKSQLPPLGRAGPSMKSYLPPIFV